MVIKIPKILPKNVHGMVIVAIKMEAVQDAAGKGISEIERVLGLGIVHQLAISADH